MLNISSNTISLRVITLGTLLTTLGVLPLNVPTITNAQTRTTSSNPENWQLRGKTDWTFPSEDESISVQDDLEELKEYQISEPGIEADLEITEEERKWGNRGDVEDYFIEVEVYDY